MLEISSGVAGQRVQEFEQVSRQGRMEMHIDTGLRMLETKVAGMQRLPPEGLEHINQSRTRARGYFQAPSIDRVPRKRMPLPSKMDANLVSAARFQANCQKTVGRETLKHPVMRYSRLTFFVDGHAGTLGSMPPNRCINCSTGRKPVVANCPVFTMQPPFLEITYKSRVCANTARNQQ